MYGDNTDVSNTESKTLSEKDWNTTSTATTNAYNYSKVVAEREAWKMYEAQDRWEMVVINPGFVVGPSLSPESASGSLYLLEAMYRGENKMGIIDLHYPVADVREVAQAHVVAGEDTTTKGRFIIAGERSLSLLKMANAVRPAHKTPNVLPTRTLPKLIVYIAGPFMGVSIKWVAKNIGIPFKVDNRRSVSELKIKYRPLEDTMADHYNAWLRNSSSH
jgi:dihydroflavonol-4-reductase